MPRLASGPHVVRMANNIFANRALIPEFVKNIRVIAVNEQSQAARFVEEQFSTAYKPDDVDTAMALDEFKELFDHKYSVAGQELDAALSCSLLSLVGCSRRFVDLGSSTGRVPLAAALLDSECVSSGIELSTSRHRVACRAGERLRTAGALSDDASGRPRLQLVNGDIFDPKGLADVLPRRLEEWQGCTIWCAVRARTGRKQITALHAALRQHSARLESNKSGGRGGGDGGVAPTIAAAPTRLLLAGFALSRQDTPTATKLHGGYVFVRALSDAERAADEVDVPLERMLSLFGRQRLQEHGQMIEAPVRRGSRGPRVVVEYHL